ncbi:MAG: hypothetical protein ACLQHK_03130 [Gallionellaceae bacterium]
MEKSISTSAEVSANSVLTSSDAEENLPTSPAGNAGQIMDSQSPNNCSVPESEATNIENNGNEKDYESTYDARRAKCMNDLETLPGNALKLSYPKEYKTWSNSKNRSKKLKGITGPQWGPELDTFPGFLKQLGPKKVPDDSLDRIDPSFGYVVGNIRWASKQLQSENRQNVETIMVRGVPMTKPQLAGFLGIRYDALRMRLNRGETAESILADFFKAEKPATTKSLAAKIEACPWPDGKEQHWERAFQAERHKLLAPHEEDSRTAFFVAKCQDECGYLNAWGQQYAETHGYDVPMPPKWIQRHEYWKRLRNFALEQRDVVLKEHHAKTHYNLDPSPEELSMVQELLGGPSSVTDEDIARPD